MFCDDGYRQNFDDIDINITNQNVNTNMNANANNNMYGGPQMGTVTCPVTEPMRERVVQRTILHEVPQV